MSRPIVVGYLAKVSRLPFDKAIFSRSAAHYERLGKMDTRTKKKYQQE